MVKRLFVLIIFVFLFSSLLLSVEISGGIGKERTTDMVLYGNVSWGFFPFISTEFQYAKNLKNENKYYMLGFYGKIKLHLIAPFVRVGVGYGGYDISLTSAKFYYYYGGGLGFYLMPIMGLKAGYTKYFGKTEDFSRFYAGLFVKL